MDIKCIYDIKKLLFVDEINIENSSHVLSVAYCKYDQRQFKNNDFKALGIICPQHITEAVIKRKSEYLAGRYMAKTALGEIGVTWGDIPTGKNRSPVWPANTVGSITHSNNIAICCVANNLNIKYLGIDIEHLMESNLAREIKINIITEREEVYLQSKLHKIEQYVTLAFSAKESLFKAIYQYVGFYFDFMAAEVIFIDNDSFKPTFRTPFYE
jgi:enterobactin synthetase component D